MGYIKFTLGILFASLTVLPAFNASACIGRMYPKTDQPEIYAQIFEATVIRVYNVRAHGADFTPPHDLVVKVTKSIKGDVSGPIVLERVSGCGFTIPKVGDAATFYVMKAIKGRSGDVHPGTYKSNSKPRNSTNDIFGK